MSQSNLSKATPEQRKQQLLAEGALYRTQIVLARHELQHEWRGATLMKGAGGLLRHVTGHAGLKNNWQALLPAAMHLFSAVSGNGKLKRLLRIGGTISTLLVVGRLALKKSGVKSHAKV